MAEILGGKPIKANLEVTEIETLDLGLRLFNGRLIARHFKSFQTHRLGIWSSCYVLYFWIGNLSISC